MRGLKCIWEGTYDLQISEAYYLACMLAGRAAADRGYDSLRAFPGILRTEVDDWIIEVHAQDEEIDGLSPAADGSVANEDAFCYAARAALRPSTNGAQDK